RGRYAVGASGHRWHRVARRRETVPGQGTVGCTGAHAGESGDELEGLTEAGEPASLTIIEMMSTNSFGAAAKLGGGDVEYQYFRLACLEEKEVGNISRLPFSTRILLENLLRHEDGRHVTADDVDYVARGVGGPDPKEISFMPARVLLQDFTGVPAVVDLAAMRDALAAMGSDPKRANPLLPADLVIDHSVQVDRFGSKDAFDVNALLEFQRNRERYILLRWGQTAFRNFRVVPPDTGIVHQVNLE